MQTENSCTYLGGTTCLERQPRGSLNSAQPQHILVCPGCVLKSLVGLCAVCLQVVATFKGECLEGCHYKHPLYERNSPLVIGGDYITTDSGTGLVHTAPGHGQEDYQV